MQYQRLGSTGLEVSRLCLGCLSFGEGTRGDHPWTLSEEFSEPILRSAVEAGINYFDTANIYSVGSSEEITGRLLKKYTRREEVVIATKVYGRMHEGPNGFGLSRKHITREIDESLKRLQTDYVDLYQVHRWDPDVDLEETMGALHDVVRAGKALHIGASSFCAWQLSKANHIAERNGWTKFSSIQSQYNLLYREDERELIPFCQDAGLAYIPWSPLARGLLARPVGTKAVRKGDPFADRIQGLNQGETDEIIDRVEKVARKHNVSMSEVAITWILSKQFKAPPLLGVSKVEQLTSVLNALNVMLAPEDIALLEEPYSSRPPIVSVVAT